MAISRPLGWGAREDSAANAMNRNLGSVGPPRRALICECGKSTRNPHPKGWCRFCGKDLPKEIGR